VGEISSDQGWFGWVRVGVVPPEILQPSIGGRQDINIVVRLVDMDNLPEVYLGFGEGELWMNTLEYSHNFKEKGYSEEAQHRDEARALCVRIGMAVAMADGELDDTEGKALKNWIKRMITPFSDEKQKDLKKIYNNSLKESYELAEAGELILSDICTKINEIGEEAQKYEALELAHEVMAADGIIHEDEMKIIHKVAIALNIDSDELEKIRDQQIVKLDAKASNLDVEGLIGIDTSLSNEEIKIHLRKEFQKWNNRLNTLVEGDERDNAQQMLDLISKARKKYG
ncbi:MAG TPA: TerB family tellurite resistance protein, partial [Flavobacteriales bacterium]|nr:TerB family tellurite resistance protein [Flavobacteriales bacterium]